MKKALGVFGLLILIALIFTLVSATNIQKGAWDTGKATSSSHGVGGNEFDTLLIIVDEDTTILTTDTSATGYSISIWQISDSSNLNFGISCNYIQPSCIFSGIFAGECDTITDETQHGVIVGGLVNRLSHANKSFIGGGKYNAILDDSMCAIIGGEADTIFNGSYGHWSGIVAGYGNIIKAQKCFIGAGELNYISGIKSSIISGDCDTILSGGGNVILGGGNNKIYESSYSTILGGCYNYINSLGDLGVTIVGGREDTIYRSDYASIIGGRYNYINEGDYSIINGGSSNYIEGSYSTIFSGKACSTWTKYATAMGFESKVYGAIDDSINFAGGVGGVCDSTMGSFAWNCKVKDADSTFGFCKQIWVMKGIDTTIITSTKVLANKIESRFFFQELLQEASSRSAASGANASTYTGFTVLSPDSFTIDSLRMVYSTTHNDVYIDSLAVYRGYSRTTLDATVVIGDGTNVGSGSATYIPHTYIVNQKVSFDWRILIRIYVATSGVAGTGYLYSAKLYGHY